MIYLLPSLGALLHRICGGLWADYVPGGTQAARLVWALPTGLLCGLLTGSVTVGAACALAVFVGRMIPHGWAMLGDLLGTVGMASIGLGRMALVAVPVYVLTDAVWWPLLIAGMLAGPAYWIAWRTPIKSENFGQGTALAELLTGGLIWAGLILSTTG